MDSVICGCNIVLRKSNEGGLAVDGRKKTLAWVVVLFILVLVSIIFVKPQVFAAFYVNRGDNYLEKNDFHSAFSSYSQAIQENSNSHSAYVGRARANLHLKQANAALSDINQAMRFGADSSEAHFVRGVVMAANDQHLLAISEYRLVVFREPSSPLAHLCNLNIARSYDRLKDFQSAIIAYNQYIKEAKSDDPQMNEAKALLAAAEKRAAEKPTDWKLVAESNSPKDFVNTKADRFILEWLSSDKTKSDVVTVKFPETGWTVGNIANNQHYEFFSNNESMGNFSRRFSVTFVTMEKHLSISQFSANFVAPMKAKPEIRVRTLSSDEKEAVIESIGPNGFSFSRVIKGLDSIVVITFFARISSVENRTLAEQLVRGSVYSNQWPKDGPPQPKPTPATVPRVI